MPEPTILIVAVALFLTDPAGSGKEIEIARVFHEMRFPEAEECEQAKEGAGRDIAGNLAGFMRSYWAQHVEGVESPETFDVRAESRCVTRPAGSEG